MGIIDRIFRREGRLTNDPADSGGETDWGISRKAHPEAWADGKVTEEEARRIYITKYLKPFEKVEEDYLKEQLVDFGVTSHPITSAKTLQRILGVPQDGLVGPQTVKAIRKYTPQKIYGYFCPPMLALNLAFERERAAFYVRLAQKRPKDLKFLFGWLKRTIGIRDESGIS